MGTAGVCSSIMQPSEPTQMSSVTLVAVDCAQLCAAAVVAMGYHYRDRSPALLLRTAASIKRSCKLVIVIRSASGA